MSDNKAQNTNEEQNASEETKVKYITVGTIKTIDLTNHTFTIEPISAYRFQTKDDDEKSWKIIIRVDDDDDPSELKLRSKDMKFKFGEELSSGVVLLKQQKTKVEIRFEQEDGIVVDQVVAELTIK